MTSVRVLPPQADIRSGHVVLDLSTGDFFVTQRALLPLPEQLWVPFAAGSQPPSLTTLSPLAQKVLDGAQADGQLTLAADEAYDELIRTVFAAA
jgi:hypothetical protein